MNEKKSILFVTDYGIYPELTKALANSGAALATEHLMRKAIKRVKNDPPDLLIVEFFHEPQFRDRVSNLESILAQLERNQKKSRVLVLFYPEHKDWLPQLRKVFSIDTCLPNDSELPVILEAVDSLLKNH
ncbi:MAG: hypothetical protein KDJ38_00760 [Gammaproteobacteria bacterium]|nr:hypothetical protein [Gammaproteobacteria bacterium]